jgi:hypothetical protein
MRTTIVLLLITPVAASAADAAGPPLGYPTAKTKVASGTWKGHSWTLLAGESWSKTSFAQCMKLVIGARADNHGGESCGGGGLRHPGEFLLTRPPAPGFGYGIASSMHTVCPTFVVWSGLVLANARTVVFTLAHRKTLTAPTIPSPPGFAQSLRFWATNTPCGANVTSIVARDQKGRSSREPTRGSYRISGSALASSGYGLE